MSAPAEEPATAEQQLVDEIGAFTHDPLGFVEFVFPWGEPGTALENHTGPRDWQRDVLEEIGLLPGDTGHRRPSRHRR